MKNVALKSSLMLTLGTLCFVALAQTPANELASDLANRRNALADLLKEQWQYNMSHSPEMASVFGDKRYNDQLSDFSPAAVKQDLARSREFLRRFEALDVTGLSEQEHLNRTLMLTNLRQELEGERFKAWEMPVVQNGGVHLFLPQLASLLSFENVKDYNDYLARLHKMPKVLAQTMELMRAGMKDGLMPPKFLLEKVSKQCSDIALAPLDQSPFAQPLGKMPKSISKAERARLTKAIHAAIANEVAPAYRKLAAFVQDEYAPRGRTEVGYWALPDGVAHYAYKVKANTTTDLTPEQIHQLGLREVARIEGEMKVLAAQQGYNDLRKFDQALKSNPDLFPKSRQEIVDLYRNYTEQMYPKLPLLFGHLPKAGLEVRQVEAFREEGASGAQYTLGSPDGSRKGSIQVNTSNFANRSRITMESTALHEGVPGHHLQAAIAQELPTLPEFRKYTDYTAFIEGWALYAETLGRDVGAYQSPTSYYGHLQQEMMRAIRLVVDTGLHAKKWSRQDVVDFFHAHSGIDEVEVQSETDRYIADPGQALAYKLGQLKFSQLRSYASEQLGNHFDIRAFHDVALGSGALPLGVLDQQVKNWVGQQKAQASTTGTTGTPGASGKAAPQQ
jgi:uncharacterized protein (DUF885 family)